VAVADAVHYAHQRGILHRDLKPANIIIDSAGLPHVTDFGLAKRVEMDSSLTLSGEVLGTPAYMAPEQAAAKAGQITTAADIYSLGAILYELLTGQPTFRRDSSMETLHAVVHDEPIAPRVLNRAAPRDLETICLKCLEKQPARRYTSAQALAEDLRRFISGEPVQARPLGTPSKIWRWCRRKPALAASLVLLTLALALGISGVLWQWHSARQKAFVARQNLYAADIGAIQRALEQDNRRQALDLLRRQIPKPGEPDLRGFEWRYLWRFAGT
jgi:serine/threonine-protein kinase